MKRKLFTIFAAISLVLCLATGMLWARSCDVFDVLLWSRASLAEPRFGLRSYAIGMGEVD